MLVWAMEVPILAKRMGMAMTGIIKGMPPFFKSFDFLEASFPRS